MWFIKDKITVRYTCLFNVFIFDLSDSLHFSLVARERTCYRSDHSLSTLATYLNHLKSFKICSLGPFPRDSDFSGLHWGSAIVSF